MDNHNMNGKKGRKLLIGGVSLVLIAVCSVLVYIAVFDKNSKGQEEEEELASQVVEKREKGEAPKIDFAQLKSINEDIYAWIEIPNTDISYPLMQSSDDQSYYLNYTFDKKKDIRGAIYTENYNKKDFTDNNTVIYGHNMKDNSMFTQLHRYEDEAFLKESPYVHIYTPEKSLKYQVFAAVEYDDRHLMKSINFEDVISYEEFLADIRNRRDMVSHVNDQVPVDQNDRIITLSTCNGSKEDTRWLVEAVLVEEKEIENE